MAKVHPLGAVVASLALSFSLVGCDGAEPEPSSVAEPSSTQAAVTSVPEPAEPKTQAETFGTSLVVGFSSGAASASATDLFHPTASYGSLDELADALSSGKFDLAVVADVDSSVLYNLMEGRLLAVSATAGVDGRLLVSVVSLDCFSKRPEEVVSYVTAEGDAADDQGLDFFRGSAMQNELSLRIKYAYAEDPASVGNEMPPDNFYFLG